MFFEDDVLSKKCLIYSQSIQGLDKKVLFIASCNMLALQNHML